jgi:hypothetical protein
MPKKRFSAEQIVVLLRQIEVLLSQGKTLLVACREAGISQQSYYRWRKEYGGLEVGQAKRMNELERENVRQVVKGIREKYGLSERLACRIVEQPSPPQSGSA